MIKNKIDKNYDYDEWLKLHFLIKELEYQKFIKKQLSFINKAINRFKKKGIVVKAWTTMLCEHTWFFETEIQTIEAHKFFNKTDLDGWYYCFDELEQNKRWYIEKCNELPTIHYY